MNSREAEVMALRLEQEKQVLDDLKKSYAAAYSDVQARLDDLEKQIADIEAKGGDATSKIYQRNYQRQLREGISPIVDAMRDGNEALVTKYLIDSYENGFIGAAYSFHGQGLPLNIPIDYRSVYNTVTTTNGGIPLSERLWKDTPALKDKIRQEVSRGIASADSYANIARNLKKAMNTDMNKAYRIARTEAGRVTSASSFDYAQKAKDLGADVLKQWSAALDMRTRELHYMLHGQLRELEEPFDVLGMEGMYPGDFGAAEMDINCRCAMLQRARWALGKEELDRVGKPIEAEDYKKFRGEYKTIAYHETKDEIYSSVTQQGAAVNENLVVTNAVGNILFEYTSDKESSIELDSSIIAYLRAQPPNSLVSIHNHPNGGAFSASDISAALALRSVKETRVVAYDGTEYSLVIGDGDRPDAETLKKVYDTVRNDESVAGPVWDKERAGLATAQEAFEEHTHAVNETLADYFGWEYRRTRP
jgi:SPP1 gp7 family putative phage head morphogenesis protein